MSVRDNEIWFAQNQISNNLFSGITWSYIRENKTILLTSSSSNNVLSSCGSDGITLTTAHLPAHSHNFSGSTSNFDYGTKTTSWGGDHTHGIPTGRQFGSSNMPVVMGGMLIQLIPQVLAVTTIQSPLVHIAIVFQEQLEIREVVHLYQ